MLSKELLDLAAGIIPADQREVLEESYRTVTEALRELYLAGSEIQLDERRISRSDLKNLDLRIRDTYGLVDYDYDLIDFLVCFELGFNEKVVPKLQKRGTLKTIGGSVLVYAANRFIQNNRGSQPMIATGETEIFHEMLEAQEARWQCEFHRCSRILESLRSGVSSSYLSSTQKQYWLGCITDLKVESSFTTSDAVRNYGPVSDLAEEVISVWADQQDFVKLTHAYLRKAILFRQRSLLPGVRKASLIATVDTLNEAEEAVVHRLTEQKDESSKCTLFALYTEIAKSFAQTGAFSSAWRFFRKAASQLESVTDLALRRSLDLFRAKAVILAEQNSILNLYEIHQMESCIEEMRRAINDAEMHFGNDLVLHEILVKDLIPLLAAVGYSGRTSYREEAQNLLLDCRQKALQLGLFHQMRGLNFIADKFSLHLRR